MISFQEWSSYLHWRLDSVPRTRRFRRIWVLITPMMALLALGALFATVYDGKPVGTLAWVFGGAAVSGLWVLLTERQDHDSPERTIGDYFPLPLWMIEVGLGTLSTVVVTDMLTELFSPSRHTHHPHTAAPWIACLLVLAGFVAWVTAVLWWWFSFFGDFKDRRKPAPSSKQPPEAAPVDAAASSAG